MSLAVKQRARLLSRAVAEAGLPLACREHLEVGKPSAVVRGKPAGMTRDDAANFRGLVREAVSKRNFASKYALVTRCYAKQDEGVLRCMSPCSVCIKYFFQLKMLRISSH